VGRWREEQKEWPQMTQMGADLRRSDQSGDLDHQKSLQRTGLAFAIIFVLGIGFGFLLFKVPTEPNYDAVWILLLATWISYWIVAFRSRALDFKRGWRFVGSLVLSIAAASITVIVVVAIVLILSGRGT